SLAPPPGARAVEARAAAPVRQAAAEVAPASPADVALPETVIQGAPAPGRLFVEAGTLSRHDAAGRLAARIPGARIEAFGPRRDQQYRVRLGPFADVASADAALERTLAAGVSGARILVD
ncbi:SPOR domain-containing protein, partial [Neoroseomonas soli]